MSYFQFSQSAQLSINHAHYLFLSGPTCQIVFLWNTDSGEQITADQVQMPSECIALYCLWEFATPCYATLFFTLQELDSYDWLLRL